ncbi:MAG: SPFH domain-containing protein [Clostridia bacterium]|nr:SPFH domain-containing protein [Clostridia bacterium]
MARICEVIKYEGDNSTFIWKHPSEDFNSLTQLIVHESQEAIFFMNGKAMDTFGPGRYTLETQNIPIIGKALKLATGGVSPFHCEVYFINKTVQMGIKWGTPEKIRYIDPDFGIPLELGASGEMNLTVCDGRKLLVKLVGTMNGISWEDRGSGFTKSLQNCFRPLITTAVKSNLTRAIKAGQFDILEVDEHLEELSSILGDKIVGGFEEYGLTVEQFYLTTVVLPENDPNFKRLRELHSISLQNRVIKAEATIRTAKAQAEAEVTAAERAVEMERQTTETEVAKREAERKVIGAQAEAEAIRQAGFAEAQVMQAQGITKKDYVQAEVQKAFAEGMGNMGSGGGNGGSLMGDIVGLGVGLQAAGAMSGQIGNIFAGMNQQQQPTVQPTDDMASFKAKIDKLTMMKEAGLLSEEEFVAMKAKLLAEIV